MASKRVNKLAGEFVTKMLAEAGITKSAGTTAQFMPYAVGLAESVVMVEKQVKRAIREVGRHQEQIGRLIDENGERISMLAERWTAYAGAAVRPVEQVRQGVVDLDLQKFRVGLVEKQAAPEKMNGHGPVAEDGPAPFPPMWHPEQPGGGV